MQRPLMWLNLYGRQAVRRKLKKGVKMHFLMLIFSRAHTLILFYKQRFISNTKYEKTSWTVAYKTEWVYTVHI